MGPFNYVIIILNCFLFETIGKKTTTTINSDDSLRSTMCVFPQTSWEWNSSGRCCGCLEHSLFADLSVETSCTGLSSQSTSRPCWRWGHWLPCWIFCHHGVKFLCYKAKERRLCVSVKDLKRAAPKVRETERSQYKCENVIISLSWSIGF